jgi:hypothetical protein
MWVEPLSLAWHEKQVPVALEWSKLTLSQLPPDVWHSSQLLLLAMWVEPLSLAWHEKQVPVTWLWSTFAFSQLTPAL